MLKISQNNLLHEDGLLINNNIIRIRIGYNEAIFIIQACRDDVPSNKHIWGFEIRMWNILVNTRRASHRNFMMKFPVFIFVVA